VEFDQLSDKGDNMKKRSEIYKTVEIEIARSWLDTSKTPASSETASVVKLVH
jgi:hypothetical protein